MRWKQILAILRLEAAKSFATKRMLPVYLLALGPVLLFGLHSLAVTRGWSRCRGAEDQAIYAAFFQVFMLRLAIFFGCVSIFMNLFRGEVLEKSLHYYFLAPVRRDVLVAGKFLSGLISAMLVFGLSTMFSYLIMAAHVAGVRHQDMELGHLGAYLGVTVLACVGYGAVFTAMGLFWRNPIVPAVAALIWESINVFLPPLLKKCSVIFYLESLCPVQVPFSNAGRLFAMSADPPPAWLAVSGLILLAAAVLAAASLRIRRMEIRYGAE